MAKLSPRDKMNAALSRAESYEKTVKDSQTLLSQELVKKNDSMRTTIQASYTMASENLASEVGSIWRLLAETIGNDPAKVRNAVHSIYPSVEKVEVVK